MDMCISSASFVAGAAHVTAPPAGGTGESGGAMVVRSLLVSGRHGRVSALFVQRSDHVPGDWTREPVFILVFRAEGGARAG